MQFNIPTSVMKFSYKYLNKKHINKILRESEKKGLTINWKKADGSQ